MSKAPYNNDWSIAVHLRSLIEDAAVCLMHFADKHDRPDLVLYRTIFLDKLEYDMKIIRENRRGTNYSKRTK